MARGGKLWLPKSSHVAISCKISTSMEISAPGDVGTKLSRGNTWSVLALDGWSSVAGRAEGVSKLPGCEVIGTFWLHVSVSRPALRCFSAGQSASCLDLPTELLSSIEGSGEERSSIVTGGRPITLVCFQVLGRSSTLRNFFTTLSLVSSSVLFVASFTWPWPMDKVLFFTC